MIRSSQDADRLPDPDDVGGDVGVDPGHARPPAAHAPADEAGQHHGARGRVRGGGGADQGPAPVTRARVLAGLAPRTQPAGVQREPEQPTIRWMDSVVTCHKLSVTRVTLSRCGVPTCGPVPRCGAPAGTPRPPPRARPPPAGWPAARPQSGRRPAD